MPSKLKPCPFCGSRAKLLRLENGTLCVYTVHCLGARCVGNYNEAHLTPEKAISAWNRKSKRGA